MLDKSKIIEQVKKLLEVNQSNGATESEEKIALEKANMLIEKYQIEKYQLKRKSSNTHEYFVLKTWDRKGTQEQCFYGFLEEFGEITGKLKKAHRDDVPEQEKQAGLKKELGDWRWYIIHLGYLRKSIDFNQQQFKPDNLQTNKKPQQVIMSISSKIGMMVNGMAEGKQAQGKSSNAQSCQ